MVFGNTHVSLLWNWRTFPFSGRNDQSGHVARSSVRRSKLSQKLFRFGWARRRQYYLFRLPSTRNVSFTSSLHLILKIARQIWFKFDSCESVVTNQTSGSSYCEWNYNGQGIEYQILAGPSFILAFSIGGLLIGALADRYNRYTFLASFSKKLLIWLTHFSNGL